MKVRNPGHTGSIGHHANAAFGVRHGGIPIASPSSQARSSDVTDAREVIHTLPLSFLRQGVTGRGRFAQRSASVAPIGILAITASGISVSVRAQPRSIAVNALGAGERSSLQPLE
jgi:hypothetical protein